MISGIVLAAGESKRMGHPKQLLPFGKKTLIETVVDHVCQSQVKQIIVVLGAHKERIAKKLAGYPVSMVFNARYRHGMLSSIQLGFTAIAKDASAALVILGDQPTIPAWVIDHLIDAYKISGKGIIVPVFQGRRGHPVLFDCKYRDEVAALDHTVGLRALVHGHPDDVEEVIVESSAILKDIDYPEDYVQELRKQEDIQKRPKKEDS
jgi:molybdenum cofactor cytidylyltransferase